MTNVNRLAEMLEERGFHVFFVGGFVRDWFRGVDCNDVDVATNATPEEVEDVFRHNHKVATVGKSFGVVIVDGVEIATFRTDSYAGFDHKNCRVTYAKTIEEDLSRRDFTMNAMARDLRGNLIDPFNGWYDVKRGVIRFVGNARARIVEDPNRMLRACRFAAQLGWYLDDEAKEAIFYNTDLFRCVAPERRRAEILKAMKGRAGSRFFCALKEVGLLDAVFPSLARCVDHTGGNYHPEDVFTHSMLTGDKISTSCPLTRLAGYLHDVGKPATYNSVTGQFLEHEKEGADFVREELKALKFSNEEIRAVTGLVEMHMRTATVITDRGVRRLLRKLTAKGVNYRDYLRLFIADRNSNTGISPMSTKSVRHLINTVEDQMTVELGVTKVTDLAVNGHDVMRIKGFGPGKHIGQILEHLLTVVVEDPSLNTKEMLENILQTS